jgi:hypothetical protein
MFKRIFYTLVIIATTMVLTTVFHPLSSLPSFAQPSGCQTFPETGKTVCGRFLEYWQKNGGLAQQGLPLSGQFSEVSELNGKTYTVQYFERAVFEQHPENQPPYDVLLSQLGTFQFQRKYPNGDPSGAPQPTQPPAQPTAAPEGGPKFDLVDYTTYKPAYGGKRAVGYTKNTGSVDLGHISVVATFKDAGGKIVGTSTDSCSCVLRPGDFFPFSVDQSSSDPEFASVDFQLTSSPASQYEKSSYYNDFQVSDLNVVPPAGYNGLKVLGTVRNTGTSTASLPQIHVLILDANGKTLDVDSTFASVNPLAPGTTSPFEVEFDFATEAPDVKVAVYSFTQ